MLTYHGDMVAGPAAIAEKYKVSSAINRLYRGC